MIGVSSNKGGVELGFVEEGDKVKQAGYVHSVELTHVGVGSFDLIKIKEEFEW
ncbi:hypothetical protein HUG15_02650 [Salicibibacter cibarius]|uniref:Uncharacterized protein n=1 Tax=Salicibibacter cibarius TaxID=2743000 RepID=A0A7T6Z0W6_9BACI|nr:hypothetical protein HUG15_02650 [Salicibibacter cibarius]